MKCGLGQEDVLHYQMLELGESRARMVRIRVRHRRVLTHDVHALYLAGVYRIHDLDHCKPALGVEWRAPCILKLFANVSSFDQLVIRVHHGNEPSVGSTLHIVLPA